MSAEAAPERHHCLGAHTASAPEVGRGSASFRSLLLSGFLAIFASPSHGDATDPADLCLAAARQAAAETGVPFAVMHAISLSETGRKRAGRFRPWPWTVNMEGKGVWFDTRAEAEGFALDGFEAGARSFDIGCFQINWRWHGTAFASVEAAFDPLTNARYAASFLADLYAETGAWTAAAGAYHSRTAKHADRYAARFARILASLTDMDPGARPPQADAPPDTLVVAAAEPSKNTFPLLQALADGATSTGSLVHLPEASNATPLLTPTKGALF